MKVYAVAEFVPNSTPYLTKGKKYTVIDACLNGFDDIFVIHDDDGVNTICSWSQCAHLYFESWTRIEEPDQQEINPTPREVQIADHIYQYLSEQSMGDPFSVDNVMALLMTAVSSTGDNSIHLHGDKFGAAYQQLLQQQQLDENGI